MAQPFANGYGDENPLWCDLCMRRTPVGRIDAAPAFHTPWSRRKAAAEGRRPCSRDPLRGSVPPAVMEFECGRLRIGDRLVGVAL